MALNTIATFTPSGYLTMSAPPPPPASTSDIAQVLALPTPNTLALPAGSSPDKVLIQNLGDKPAFVLLTTAAASTTGTAAIGTVALTVASPTSIVAGQAAIGVGLAEGTSVVSITGSVVTLNQPTTGVLSTTAVKFVTQVTRATGIAVLPRTAPIALAYVASGYISAVSANPMAKSILNIAVGV